MIRKLRIRKNFNNLLQKIKTLLLKGVTPEKLALTISIGIIIGLFPVIGVTTAIAAIAALGLRLNQAFIQVVNYTVYPLQLVLFIPFIKFGNQIFTFTPNQVNFQHLFHMMQTKTLAAIGEFSSILFGAILLWILVALPLSILIYHLSLKYLKRKHIKI